MSADHQGRLARIDSRNEHALRHPRAARAPHGLSLLECQADMATAYLDMEARRRVQGGCPLAEQDPRDLAGRLVAYAETLRLGVLSESGRSHEVASEVGALAAALRMAVARVEADSPFTGNDAA